jgi:catechol 2,3-dioxygenase-like lactoylglutathione lyase family enzyme
VKPSIIGLVPMAHVADVPRSIAFYELLGFRVKNTFTPPGSDAPVWAWVEVVGAQLMLTKADLPIDPTIQAVLFYLYAQDLPRTRDALAAAGVEVGPIHYPMHAPRGEFRLMDPDGYVLMIMHAR